MSKLNKPHLWLLGAGAMGRAAARYLLGRGFRLTLADARQASLDEARRELSAHGLEAELWLGDVAEVASELRRSSPPAVMLLSLPWQATRAALLALGSTVRRVVSITRPAYRDLDELRAWSSAQGVSLILGAGLEPGLVELLGAELAERDTTATELHLRCGGLSLRPRPPLFHTRWFGDVLPLAARPTFAVEGGRQHEVRRFEGVELVFVEGIGLIEAYHDGMLPDLHGERPFSGLERISQKTLRWPGFAESVQLLRRLGLLAEEPVTLADGRAVSPKELLDAVLRDSTSPASEEPEISLLRAELRRSGEQEARLRCTVSATRSDGLTGMAKLTGFTHVFTACALLGAERFEAGVWFPHQVLRPAQRVRLFRELESIGVSIRTEGFSW